MTHCCWCNLQTAHPTTIKLTLMSVTVRLYMFMSIGGCHCHSPSWRNILFSCLSHMDMPCIKKQKTHDQVVTIAKRKVLGNEILSL